MNQVNQADCYACKIGDACPQHVMRQDLFRGSAVAGSTAVVAPAPVDDRINPAHYAVGTAHEHVKVAEALGWVGNAFVYTCTKYLWRYGRKGGAPILEDLRKARWYLDREIKRQEQLEKDARLTAPATCDELSCPAPAKGLHDSHCDKHASRK